MKELELELIQRGFPRVYARSGKELSEFLTFYYVPELDAIVLNKNHKNYGHFKELLPIYLQFNNLQKKEFLPMPRGMGMTFFDSVNKVLRVRKKIKNSNKYKQYHINIQRGGVSESRYDKDYTGADIFAGRTGESEDRLRAREDRLRR